jgi:hypothetical protein
MFRALLAHPQEALHIRHLVYCVRVMSVGCYQGWSGTGVADSRDSTVGIATGYGLDGPGIESRWGRDFSHMSRPALGPTLPAV